MIVINDNGCIKCRACEGACPTSAIDATGRKIVYCDTCGDDPKCADICPNGALTVDYLSIEEDKDDVIRLVFNALKCDECGKCTDVCPQGTLTMTGDEKMPVSGFCVMCQQCVDVCPIDIIGIPGIVEPESITYDVEGKGAIYIDGCVGCGSCVEFCPVEAIVLDEIGQSIAIDDTKCIKCGVCSQTCPWNKVFISEKVPEKRTKEIAEFTFDQESCIGCNTCVEACPGNFINPVGSNLSVKVPESCAACGLCVNLCPVDALSIAVEWGDAKPADAEGLGRDAEKCDFIGACALKCPTEAIRVVTKTGMEVPKQVEVGGEPDFASCIRCGGCAASCPNGALNVGSIELEIDGEMVFKDRIEFNPSKCDECGDCIDVCPYDMLHKSEKPNLPIAGFCTLCGQCITACPEDALCYK